MKKCRVKGKKERKNSSPSNKWDFLITILKNRENNIKIPDMTVEKSLEQEILT
jgi:hypothetical protein